MLSILNQFGALVLVTLVTVAALAYWGFSPVFQEQRRVRRILQAFGAPASAGYSSFKPAILLKIGMATSLTIAALLFAQLFGQWQVAAVIVAGLWMWLMSLAPDWTSRILGTLFSVGTFGLFARDDLAKSLPASYLSTAAILAASLLLTNFFSPAQEKMDARPSEPVRDAYNSGDYEKAIELAWQAELLPVTRAGELMAWAQAHFHRAEFDAAEELARRGLVIGSDANRVSSFLVLLSHILAERGENAEARRALDTAERLAPANAEINFARALCELRQGQNPARAQELLAGIAGSPKSMAALAWAFAENGMAEQARKTLPRVDLEGSPEPEAAEACYYAARAALKCGDEVAAKAFIQEAVSAEPAGLFGTLASQL